MQNYFTKLIFKIISDRQRSVSHFCSDDAKYNWCSDVFVSVALTSHCNCIWTTFFLYIDTAWPAFSADSRPSHEETAAAGGGTPVLCEPAADIKQFLSHTETSWQSHMWSPAPPPTINIWTRLTGHFQLWELSVTSPHCAVHQTTVDFPLLSHAFYTPHRPVFSCLRAVLATVGPGQASECSRDCVLEVTGQCTAAEINSHTLIQCAIKNYDFIWFI